MKSKLILLTLIVAAVAAFFVLDLDRFFDLAVLQAQQAKVDAYYAAHPMQALLAFFAIYVLVTTLSLPGAGIMTLAGGAVFGLLWGTIVVSFASTLGATLAFLVSRFLFKDAVQRRFGGYLQAVNDGIVRDGEFYLFFVRLVPAFPFFIVNLVMGVTPMRVARFALVSQRGMLPGTVIFVNAGTQLSNFELSAGLIGSLVALGLFPFLARFGVEKLKARQALKPFARPARFDRNVVVIGAGSAGLVAAYLCAALKARVTLIEKHRMGGDCLNTGCVPSKALIRSAKFIKHVRRAPEFGVRSAHVSFDFAQVMQRVARIVERVAPHDSVERYTTLGVECIHGEARIVSPYEVEVNGRSLTTRSIVVAAGAAPFVPGIPGIDDVGYLTSDTVWSLRELPRRLLVLGGGPIGTELTQCFARFGAEVTQVEMLPRILIREDPEVCAMVQAALEDDGVKVLVGHKAKAFRREGGEKTLICEHAGGEVSIAFDELLVAVGRAARVTGYGLEELGVPVKGTIEVDDFLRTRLPTIFACGDVAGPYQFTHVGAHQAWYAAVNALFGGIKKFRVDYSVIPWATFTDPEVARVGLNETQAREQGVEVEVSRFDLGELDRAIADEAAHGMVKVLTVPGSDRILGASIVGEHAGELIAEYVAAMRHRLGMNKILGTIHVYPTLAEANKYAAGQWKRAHAPRAVLRWLERYHAWQRG